MTIRLLLGILIGAGVGGVIGYVGKCTGGQCPLTCNPTGGIIMGALIGGLMAGSVTAGQPTGHGGTDGGSSNVVQVSDAAQFDAALKTDKPVLVDFYADWCGPCRMLKPLLHEIAAEYEGKVSVLAVNVDKNGELAARYGVMSIPDVKVFKNGKVQTELVGVQSGKVYRKALDKALAE